MSKCPKCGEPMVQMVRGGGRYVWPHKTGGVACLAHQLAQALERAVSAEEAYLKQGFRLDTEKARREKAEAERDAWRNIIAMLCGDGGQYHQQHGAAATVEYCKTRFYDLVKRADESQAELGMLKMGFEPCPTADAYEAVCKARTKWQARAEKVEADNADYKSHLDNALRQAKEVCPDYPWSASPTMSEIAWAVCSTLEGVGLACGDWEAEAKRLREAIKKLQALDVDATAFVGMTDEQLTGDARELRDAWAEALAASDPATPEATPGQEEGEHDA